MDADVFGNLIATASFVEATRALTIDSRMVVDHAASAGPGFTIATSLAYRVREEEGAQSPDETLDRSSGSYRDFATLFIEAVRHLGFGAHAVSGYLQPNSPGDQHGTTHAWAEVYLLCASWPPFDPTHGRKGGAGLIPVAVAGDIARIHPVRGSYLGAPEDFLDMQVEVTVETSSAPAGAFDAFAL